jgi:hypothetical protein
MKFITDQLGGTRQTETLSPVITCRFPLLERRAANAATEVPSGRVPDPEDLDLERESHNLVRS